MNLTPNLNHTAKQPFKHYHHAFYPTRHDTPNKIHKKYSSKIVKKPLYDYGFLNSKYAPKVETIDLKPKVEKKTLVLLPVYMRVPKTSLVLRPHDSTLRSGSWLQTHGRNRNRQITPISTIPPVSTTPVSTTPVTYVRIPNSNLLIRSNNLPFRGFWKNSGVTQNYKYSTISNNEVVSITSTNEPVSTTSSYESVSTTSTNEPVSTTAVSTG